jgi:hypothetical protein
MPTNLFKNIGWLKYVHIMKINNNKWGKIINPKPNTPKNSCLTPNIRLHFPTKMKNE